jgi:mannose/fructose/N-acetylgalactosamine-specific phosphotransferase system component IIC
VTARWRWRVFYLVSAIVEGVAIGLAVRRPVMPVVGFCLILTAMRLRLETLLP